MSLSGSSTTSGLNIMAYKAGGYTGVDYNTTTSKFTAEASSGATYTSAQAAADLQVIDAAINQVSDARSQIGAVQNQLSYTVANLQTAITNVTASKSNLTDADMATEVTAMTQQQILVQASTSVLAQANSAPQAILKLLQ
jgi:flagellin